MSVAGHFDCRIIALQKLQQQPYLLDKMLIMYHEHIIVAAQRKKANNNVTKSKNQRENKKQTKEKQTCSRQSWRSASATHVATVATSLEIKEYIQMLTFNHLNEEESILFGHLTYTNSSRHGTTWKSIRTVSIDMVPPKKQDNISFALFTDFASNAVVLVSQRSLENHIYSPVSPFN